MSLGRDKPIRILLVDDQTLVRAGLRALLQAMRGIDVVGEASNGREAIGQAIALRPDLVLMDVGMPELNGLDAAARLVARLPQVRVLFVAESAAEEFVLGALRLGAAGYVVKNVAPAEFELAIRAVASGETYLCTSVSKLVIDSYLERPGSGGSSLDRLTSRQREVLQLIAEGNTSKEIAHKLGLSVKTVEMHRSQLMAALDIHDIAGLVRYAVKAKLVCDD